jgi:Protein of unknown function (DUF2589)
MQYGVWHCVVSGPLVAVVDAQAKAAVATANFVQEIGFEDSTAGGVRHAIAVEFTYNTTNTTSGAVQTNTLSVPLLTILPVPYLRVKSCVIQFNAKVSSVQRQSIESKSTYSKSSSRSSWWSSSSLKTSVSSQTENKYSNTEAREFSMMVRVEAVQDEMPGGLAKVLSILEEAILKGVRS